MKLEETIIKWIWDDIVVVTDMSNSNYHSNLHDLGNEEEDLYSYVDNFLADDHEQRYYEHASDSLEALLTYPFKSRDVDGQPDTRYNGVERIDIVRDKFSRSVRCPVRFLEVLRYIEGIRGKRPSIGLRFKKGSVTNYVHFLFEEQEEGWIYIDTQRTLQVRQIHKIEKILDYVGLNRVGVIANKIGLPARHEVSRINSERGKIIDLHYYDTIHNHNLSDYF